MFDNALKDASRVMLRDASMDSIFCHFHRRRARHCRLQCSDAVLGPISVWFFLPVGSDVWNVRYSSARYTVGSRRDIAHWSLFIVEKDIHSFFCSGDFLGVCPFFHV